MADADDDRIAVSAGRPAVVAPTSLTGLANQLGVAPPPTEVAVTGVSSNSALVQPGDLFAALPGVRSHGADHVGVAKLAGASAVLTNLHGVAAARAAGLPFIVVNRPRDELGTVAARIYGNPSAHLKVVGITGTSGKTTTSSLVQAGLAAAGLASGLIGTLGVFAGPDVIKTAFTTPEAPQLQALLAMMAERGIGHVVMEVSSHALRLGRVDGVRFEIGAFTNLSQDHLDFHADMEDYFQAKALLFDGRAARELVMVDDDWGARLAGPGVVTASTESVKTNWSVSKVRELHDGSTRFRVVGPGVDLTTGCRIPGRYNVGNCLLALAILAEIGIDPVGVAPALAAAQVPGRMQRVDLGQPFLVVVDYSHKPAGVAAALAALAPLTSGRLMIVLGCGGDRDRGKRPVMGRVAAEHSDVLVVTDDNPRSEDPATIRAAMLAGARAAGGSGRIIEEGDRARAIGLAISLAGPGDTVLVAGKGHETGQEVGGVMLAFDDVAVSTDALLGLGFGSGSTPTQLDGGPRA